MSSTGIPVDTGVLGERQEFAEVAIGSRLRDGIKRSFARRRLSHVNFESVRSGETLCVLLLLTQIAQTKIP